MFHGQSRCIRAVRSLSPDLERRNGGSPGGASGVESGTRLATHEADARAEWDVGRQVGHGKRRDTNRGFVGWVGLVGWLTLVIS